MSIQFGIYDNRSVCIVGFEKNKTIQGTLSSTFSVRLQTELEEVLFPINLKNYNFREKRNMAERENCIIKDWQRIIEAEVMIVWFKLQIWMWLVLLNCPHNKLSNKKLFDSNLTSELVENKSFLNQSQSRKL